MIKGCRVVNGRRHLDIFDVIHNLSDGTSKDLARAGLRESLHKYDPLKSGNGPDIISHFLNDFFYKLSLNLGIRLGCTVLTLKYNECNRAIASDLIEMTHDGTLNDTGMLIDDLFKAAGR